MKSRDLTVASQARAWILSAKDRWRLQVLSKRLRLHKDGTRTEVPTRIRRFIEGVPWAYVKPAIDFLLELAPYSGVIANGVDFETKYRPTLTVWQRDAQSAAVGAVRQDATYTLIQDLVEFDNDDAYMVGSSNSCSETVETEYVWDSANVEDLPQASQGVTYGLAGVHRNEDGTFEYQLVKRVALTQHVPETVVRDDATATVTQELWDNVYTDSDGLYVDHTGAALNIPQPGIDAGVVRIEGLSENSDCTLKFQVVRETAKSVVTKDSSSHTQYEGNHEEGATGAVVPLGNAPDARGGVIQEFDSQLQPDGKFQVSRKTKVERPVGHASVEVKVGRKGRRTTVVDRNQSGPASAASVEIGGSVKTEKTPGGLYDNTVVTFDKTLNPVKAGARCREDLYTHTDTKTVGGAEMPSDDSHVEGAGEAGRVITVEADMDDEGAVTKTTVVEQEKSVLAAEERWDVTLGGVTHTKTDRNQHPSSAGTAPAFSIGNIGSTVTNRKTPGGLVDVTITEVDRTTGSLDIRTACKSDMFQHVDTVVKTDPAGTVSPNTHVVDPGGGVVRESTSELNGNGSVTKTDTVTTEKLADYGLAYKRTLRGLVTTTETRNTEQKASAPSKPGESQSHVMTPGGRYNLTVTSVEASATADSARCQKTVYEETDDSVTMLDTGIPDGFHAEDPSAVAGTYQTKTADTDEYGFTKVVSRTTTEHTVQSAQVTFRRTPRGLITTTTTRNGTTAAADPGANSPGSSQSHEITPSGRYNLTVTTVTPSTTADSRRCQKTVFDETDDEVTMGTSLTTDHATAGSGTYGTIEESIDDYGIVRKVVRTTTETEQESGHTFRRTSRGLLKTTVTRNTSAQAADPGDDKVGFTQTDEMTPGGLYNLTTTELTASTKTDSAHHSRTKFESVDDTVVMSTGSVDDSEPSRADGTTVVKDSSLDDYGFVKTVTRVTTEQAVTGARVEYRRTRRGLVTTTVDRNVTTTAADPGEDNIGCSQSHSYNPGGTTDFTKVELTASAKKDSAYCSKDLFTSVSDSVTMSSGSIDETEPSDVSVGDGKFVTKTSELDDYGFAKTVERTTTEKNVKDARLSFTADHFRKVEVRTEANSTNPDTSALSELGEGSHSPCDTEKSISYNKGGSADLVVTKVTPIFREWTDEVDTKFVVGKIFYFRNATSTEKDSVRQKAQSYADSEAEANGMIYLGAKCPTSSSFTPSCVLNSYGLYDGQYSVMFHWSAQSGGKDEDHTNKWLNEATWSYYLVTCSMTPSFDSTSGAVTGYRQVSVKRKITERIGRGWKYAVDKWVSGQNLIEGSSCSLSPATGEISMKIIEEASTSIEYVKLKGGSGKDIKWEV